jgi:hypothetical protein
MARFIATLKTITSPEFPAALKQWSTSARATSGDENILLLNLQLPKCA